MSENHEQYVTPEIRSLGSVERMTEQSFDKIGSATDAFTAISGGALDGDIVFDKR